MNSLTHTNENLDYLSHKDTSKNIYIDHNKRLSQSLIWKIQRSIFSDLHADAWQKNIIPSYITTNPFIAKTYAHLIKSYVKDCNSFITFDKPLYILELGAGDGRFAYNFLQHFFEEDFSKNFNNMRIIYVISDFVQKNIEFCSEQAKLQPYLKNGQLDFAILDVEQDGEYTLNLTMSGQTITASSNINPFVVIANYFFDSLPQDLFRIKNREILECHISLSTRLEYEASKASEYFNYLKILSTSLSCTTDYYEEEEWNVILESYRQQLFNTYLLFPTASMKCLKSLYRLSNGNLLIISSDKGYSNLDMLEGEAFPNFTYHGSFSLPVNYHALKELAANYKGKLFSCDTPFSSLTTTAFCFSEYSNLFSSFEKCFHERIEEFSPDDFYTIKKMLEINIDNFSLPQILAFIRFSCGDPQIISTCYPQLKKLIVTANKTERNYIKRFLSKNINKHFNVEYTINSILQYL